MNFVAYFRPAVREARRRSRELKYALNECSNVLSNIERTAVESAVQELLHSQGWSIGKDVGLYPKRLKDIWHPRPFKPEPNVCYDIYVPDNDKEDENKNLPWSISLSHNFVKETSTIDRKLQGRVLESLVQIAGEPMALRGDTQKPLTGDLKGLWRRRLGDYRLIYRPDQKSRRIYCLSFSARGETYA
jgi:mRNA-degrading endonuclease RelE of RelBE toxin-antitoxin system